MFGQRLRLLQVSVLVTGHKTQKENSVSKTYLDDYKFIGRLYGRIL